MTGQVLKIVALRPDAVMTGGAGTPGALPFLALAERGFKGGVYGQHGLINPDFIRVAGAVRAERADADRPGDRRRAAAERLPDEEDRARLPRRVPEGQRRAVDRRVLGLFVRRLAGLRRRRRARAKGEPGTPAFRVALRDAIGSTKEVVGTHGVYNFKAGNMYGVDSARA